MGSSNVLLLVQQQLLLLLLLLYIPNIVISLESSLPCARPSVRMSIVGMLAHGQTKKDQDDSNSNNNKNKNETNSNYDKHTVINREERRLL